MNGVVTYMKLEWGLNPVPEGVTAAWGARAIYGLEHRRNDYFNNGNRRKTPKMETVAIIELLWDRQAMVGGSDDERKALAAWVNKVGMDALRKTCALKYITAECDKTVEIHGGGYTIKASPRASYGYLYIAAYPTPEVTRTVTTTYDWGEPVVVGGHGDVG